MTSGPTSGDSNLYFSL